MTKKIKFENVKTIVENNSMEMIWTEEEFNKNYKSLADTNRNARL